MYAQIEPAERHEEDERGRAGEQRDGDGALRPLPRRKEIREHQVADRRAHRVATRKAVGVTLEKVEVPELWPGAMDRDFEHMLNCLAAERRREPGPEEQGLLAAPEDDRNDGNEDVHHRRAE